MRPSPDTSDLPPAWRSLSRTFRLGYRAEPRLLAVSLGLGLLMMMPDALLALWLKLLAEGVVDGKSRPVAIAGVGLAVSTTASWYLSIVNTRVQRRFRDRVAIALESHVARLQASVPTVEHQERPDYLDRLSVLRDQVFALDHLFMSLFSTLGWLFRLVVTVLLLASIHPLLVLLIVAALPTVFISTWRPGVERATEEQFASRNRLARHLFVLATTPAPAKEVRVTRTGPSLIERRDDAWREWYRPIAAVRWSTACWHAVAWAFFGGAYVAAIAWVAAGLDKPVGAVVLVVAAGQRLSLYVAAAVGELGFLRGIWLDSSRRLTWLEDYAAGLDAKANVAPPERLREGIACEGVSFHYPGSDRLALDDVNLFFPAGAVVAIVGENGAGKSTLVKLLARMYQPTSGRITVDGVDLATISTTGWRQRLAGAFQDFFRFELRAQHTVGLGDVPRLDDRAAVEGAVERAGADDVIDRLARGLDTQLGPTWDEGVEVSFGQWQKLALARGFLREHPLLLVLDEPTAALDAETEHALFEKYAQASKEGATESQVTVLVSHRFSTVRMADLIVVLDGARVAEVGSHDELMARQGRYAELFAIQAAAFR